MFMSIQSKTLTPEEYLAIERQAEYKHEYIDGEMIAMPGASREHNVIVANLIIELGPQLKERPCEVYPSDMRVKIPATGSYVYPDVIVVCGEPRLEDEHLDVLLNPTVVIEVLSDSTESHDRGKKFEYYRTLESVVEYVLVAQDAYRVEKFVRQSASHWLFSETHGLEAVIPLDSIQCHLALKEIYRKVSLTPGTQV
jgi:Uma2 family endonuclease